MVGFADIVSGIFKPIAEVIEHIVPSGDAKIALQQTLLQGQMAAAAQIMDYEKQLLQGQVDIVKAEAQSQSWIARNWRPITMLTFLVLVCCDSFGILPFRLAQQAWSLLQIGLGGYVVGRSVEKVAPAIASAIKNGKS